MIELENVKKIYFPKKKKRRGTLALDGITLTIGKGMTFVTGRTSCGKSTLLNVLGGLDIYDEGSVKVNGVELKVMTPAEKNDYLNRAVGFVFQEYNLIDELTVEENVRLAVKMQGETPNEEEIVELFKNLGIDGLEKKYPDEISGGQKQRVTIARALIKHPKILLADEPTGALDDRTGKEILALFRSIADKMPVVIVSHNLGFAETFGDRIIDMDGGKVVSDIIKTEKEENVAASETKKFEKAEKEEKVKQKRKKTLSFFDYRKFVGINFKCRVGRLVAMFIVCIFSFSVIGTVFCSFFYNESRVYADTLDKNDVKFTHVVDGDIPFYESLSSDSKRLGQKDIKKIEKISGEKVYPIFSSVGAPDETLFPEGLSESDRQKLIYSGISDNLKEEKTDDYYDATEANGHMELDRESAAKLGLKLLSGEFPVKTDEIAVSSYMYGVFYNCDLRNIYIGEEEAGHITSVDGTVTPLKRPIICYRDKEINNYEDLIGETILIDGRNFKISGIIDWGEEKYKKYNFLKGKYNHEDSELSELAYEWRNTILVYSLARTLFFCPDYYKTQVQSVYEGKKECKINSVSKLYLLDKPSWGNAEIYLQNSQEKGKISVVSKIENWREFYGVSTPENAEFYPSLPSELPIIWKGGEKPEKLQRNEIIVSRSNLILGNKKGNEIGKSAIAKFLADDKTVYVDGLGEKMSLKVVGIFDDDNFFGRYSAWLTAPTHIDIFFADEAYEDVVDEMGLEQFGSVILPLSGKNTASLLKNLKKAGYVMREEYTENVHKAWDLMKELELWVAGISPVMIFINVLMLANYVHIVIVDKRRQIGILRTLGAGKKELYGIFGGESGLIAAIIASGATIGAILIGLFMDSALRKWWHIKEGVTLLAVGVPELLLLWAIVMAIGLCVSYFPVRKAAKLSPAKALKNE